MRKSPDSSDMADFGRPLIEEAIAELSSLLAKCSIPTPDTAAHMLAIHYAFEVTVERFGPNFLIECITNFSKMAVSNIPLDSSAPDAGGIQ